METNSWNSNFTEATVSDFAIMFDPDKTVSFANQSKENPLKTPKN